jgi:hypothetical protein
MSCISSGIAGAESFLLISAGSDFSLFLSLSFFFFFFFSPFSFLSIDALSSLSSREAWLLALS